MAKCDFCGRTIPTNPKTREDLSFISDEENVRICGACIDAGYQLEDIISFSCTNINSYSGAYLGDMLRVKK